jgi:hypothetical protein
MLRGSLVTSQWLREPSWIPDWESEGIGRDFLSMPEVREFCASKNLDAEFIFPHRRQPKTAERKDDPPHENEARNEEFGVSLRLKGIHVDTIGSGERYFRNRSLPSKSLFHQEARLQLWEDVRDVWIHTILPLENFTRYTNREHLSNAFV